MSEGITVTSKAVELEYPELGPETLSSSHLDLTQTSPQPHILHTQSFQHQSPQASESGGHPEIETEERGPAAPIPDTGAGVGVGAGDGAGAGAKGNHWTSALNQFKLKRFFVLRPGTLDQALEDINVLINQEDGAVHGVWLMAEVDHWNNEKERVVLITDNSLLVCKYDFVMLNCEQIQRIPLNFVDRISHGNFSFPQRSLLTREGEGVRVFWDRLREPSFSSRWNPFATDYPFSTFTYHPVRNIDQRFTALCEIHSFREQLTEAAQKAHLKDPIPGKANGVLVLNQPLLIEAYVGLMSYIGNQNKLGYSLARGNIGF